MKKTLVIVISLVILLVAANFDLFKSAELSTSSETSLQNAPPTITTIGGLGRIEPRSRVIALSHDAGPDGARIEKLQVAEGQSVKAGDIIAIFSENERKKTELETAKMQVLVAEAGLEEELVNQKYYKKELERYDKLAESKVVSLQTQEETRKNYNQSLADVRSLEAQLKLAKLNVELADESLKQSILQAPLDGTIIKIHTREGERIGDYGAVEIADLSKLDVVTEVYERDMPRVKVGQKAEIIIPGFKEPFYGEVRELGFKVLKSSLKGADPFTSVDNRIVEVRITLEDEAASKLKHLIYMEVSVRLL